MTGTGTQADPYIVDTWEDFVTAVGTSGAYVEVAPDIVWDMNEISPEGVTIDWNCTSLQGNGAVIARPTILEGSMLNIGGSCQNIENICIEKAIVNSGDFIRYGQSSNTVTIKNSTISVALYDSIFENHYKTGDNNFIVDTSIISITGHGDSYIQANSTSNNYNQRLVMTNSRLELEGELPNALPPTDDKHGKLRLVNSKISGQNGNPIGICPFNILILSGYNASSSSRRFKSTTSTINCRIGSNTSILAATNASYKLDKIVINSSFVEEGATIDSSAIMVTDAEMQDPEYLASKGFPIVPEVIE